MKLAEKEHKKYHKNNTLKPKVIKEEKLPEWFDKKIEKPKISQEEQKEMQDLLKEYQ